jgi:hypothetical protein
VICGPVCLGRAERIQVRQLLGNCPDFAGPESGVFRRTALILFVNWTPFTPATSKNNHYFSITYSCISLQGQKLWRR